jgi:hypothetical protein
VTETTDLLLLVEAVGGHLHAAIREKEAVRKLPSKRASGEGGIGAYRIETISRYICFSSFLVVSRV